jgi:hypothetical protein
MSDILYIVNNPVLNEYSQFCQINLLFGQNKNEKQRVLFNFVYHVNISFRQLNKS